MIKLSPCPKGYTKDQDKAVTPEETVQKVKNGIGSTGSAILAETRRIDSGRLDIPVYMSICGDEAKRFMPTRKQMGKGASPTQAEASALMELMERYGFFRFWNTQKNFIQATYSEAEAAHPESIIPLSELIKSVDEEISEEDARKVFDLIPRRWCSALRVGDRREILVPFDWFKALNEFNGSSAGNRPEESILQGGCELVERHVCAIIDRQNPTDLPTLDIDSFTDPVLNDLTAKFRTNGIVVLLKDFSLNMGVPTVGAVAYDPETFPETSEIVFTAGTASSPIKAAVRALTEIAQLAGDFHTSSVYEASGLSKYTDLSQLDWLQQGPVVPLESLPSIERDDILEELDLLCTRLFKAGFSLYSVDTTPEVPGVATHYNFIPGFHFRERDAYASLGLFTGRVLAEEADIDDALQGLNLLSQIYPDAHFLPFFQGLIMLRKQDPIAAIGFFAQAEPVQPDADSKALAAFYRGHAAMILEDWTSAQEALDTAVSLAPDVKEYFNLRGVSKYKQERYEEAAEDFKKALALDKGSAVDLANLGIMYKMTGKMEQALATLSRALEMDPSLDFARKHYEELLGS